MALLSDNTLICTEPSYSCPPEPSVTCVTDWRMFLLRKTYLEVMASLI